MDTTKSFSPETIAAIKGFSGTTTLLTCNQFGQSSKLQKIMTSNINIYSMGWMNGHATILLNLTGAYSLRVKPLTTLLPFALVQGKGWPSFNPPNRAFLSSFVGHILTTKLNASANERKPKKSTQATCVLEEAIKLLQGDPWPTPGNFSCLKLNMTTYCALLLMLFGDKCNYYQSVMRICSYLNNAGAYNIWDSYTADIYYRISWDIINDRRVFFSQVTIQQDFYRLPIQFPESLFDSILPEVHYANQVNRATSPKEWMTSAHTGSQQSPASTTSWTV